MQNIKIGSFNGEKCPLAYREESALDPKGRFVHGIIDISVKDPESSDFGDVTSLHAESSGFVMGGDSAGNPAVSTLTIREALRSRRFGEIALEIWASQSDAFRSVDLEWRAGKELITLYESTNYSAQGANYEIAGQKVSRDDFLSVAPIDFMTPP